MSTHYASRSPTPHTPCAVIYIYIFRVDRYSCRRLTVLYSHYTPACPQDVVHKLRVPRRRAGSAEWLAGRDHLAAGPASAEDVAAWPLHAYEVAIRNICVLYMFVYHCGTPMSEASAWGSPSDPLIDMFSSAQFCLVAGRHVMMVHLLRVHVRSCAHTVARSLINAEVEN